ncbi:Endonuclease/exonuclease/phosphatase, partial [Dissophora ornata]
MPDIVAVALQEFVPYPDAFIHSTYHIKQKVDDLAQLILRTLHRTCPGHRFCLVSQSAQVGMILFILTRDGSMTEHVERISNASVGTGPGGMGNKGAIATRLSIRLPATASSRPSFDICFINAHLSAHLHMIKRRNHDYLSICKRMGTVWEESIFSCDYIFWTGDLNYRLDLSQSDGEIVHAIEQGHLRQLYSHDQLSAQRKTMNVFRGFHEAPLAFPPTYKFKMGSDQYSISKRVPAWTDRVLWFVHPRDATS